MSFRERSKYEMLETEKAIYGVDLVRASVTC